MQPVDLIKQLYADYARGDIDAVLEHCADEIAFIFTADSQTAACSGAALGKDAFRERAASLHGHFEYLAFKPIDFIAEGDRVAVRTELTMKRRTSGREFVMRVADFWTVRSGKAVELIEYYDTALAADVL